MEPSARTPPPLTAAPRHLRRRRLHQEIPDTLLVPGAQPLPLEPGRAAPDVPETAGRPARDTAPRPRGNGKAPVSRPARSGSQRKRTAALIFVILVSLSIPALILALIFAG